MMRPPGRTPQGVMAAATACLLAVLPIGAPAQAVPTVFPSDSLFTRPGSLTLEGDGVAIGNILHPFERRLDAYLVPVGSDASARLVRATLVSQTTGAAVQWPEQMTDQRALDHLAGRLTLRNLGVMRRTRLAVVAMDAQHSVLVNGDPHSIIAYEALVEGAVAGTAKDGRPFAELLGAALPEKLREGDGSPVEYFEESLPAPTAWQPRPENSPGVPWQLLAIDQPGLYAIDGQWLVEHGLAELEKRPPAELVIFSRGRPVPTLLTAPPETTFAEGQALLFHATDSERREGRARTYYLGVNAASQPRAAMEPAGAVPPGAPLHRVVARREVVSKPAIFKTEVGAFLSIQAMRWVWQQLPAAGEPLEVVFDLPGLAPVVADGRPVWATLGLYGPGAVRGGGWSLQAKSGPREASVVELTSGLESVTLGLPREGLMPRGNTVTLAVHPPEHSTSTQERPLFVDRFEVHYPALIQPEEHAVMLDLAQDDQLTTGPLRLETTGYRSARRLLALDVTRPDSPALLEVGGPAGSLTVDVPAGGGARVLLAEPHQYLRPPAPAKSVWIDLQKSRPACDVLVIHHARFREAAAKLAASHRERGMVSRLVDVESVYEAFSHGEPSAEAIRDFLAFSVYGPTLRAPHSVVLIGDATGDGRDESRQGIVNYIPAPVMASTRGVDTSQFACDSWYTWLSPGDELADVMLGRISVTTPEEAMAAVDKIIEYAALAKTPQPWGNRLVRVSDTGSFAEALAQLSRDAVAPSFDDVLLAADDFAWEDNYYLPAHLITREQDSKVSPQLTAAIEKAINEGVAVMTYFGHGAPNLWSNQRFWFGGGTPNSDILRLANAGRYPFVTSFTCNNATIDYPLKPWNICIAEDFMRHESRGAVACFMPSGPGYLSQHRLLAHGFFHAWSREGVRRHGVLAELARLSHQVWHGEDDHSRMYLLLGDPTAMLPEGSRGAHSPAPDEAIAAVSMEAVNRVGREARWLAVISQERTDSLAPVGDATTVVETTLTAPDGTEVWRDRTEVVVPPRGAAMHGILGPELDPGPYQLQVTIPGQDAAIERDRFPTSVHREWVLVDGSEQAGFVVQAVELVPGRGSRSGPMIRLPIYNGTDATIVVKGTQVLRQGGRVVLESERSITYPPGRIGLLDWTLPVEVDPFVPMELELRFPPADEVTLAGGEGVYPVAATQVSDLVIVPESIRVTPERPSSGLTIHVEGEVTNLGPATAPASRIALFEEGDAELLTPLRNMTAVNFQSLPMIPPGQTVPFRLRWDPYQNAGKYPVVVAVDYERRTLDPDRDNNRIAVPLHVLTRWDLHTAGIVVIPPVEGSPAMLVARVGNRGEVDSGPVVVNFYRTQEAVESEKLGEVIVPVVPAGYVVEVPMEWAPDLATVTAEDTEPSFTVAIRGSSQRVTSVDRSTP